MYKMLSRFLFITLLSIVGCINSETKSNIVVLNRNTFDDAIKNNEYIFVKFYASWCKFSRQLAPEYIKVAKKTSELELPVKFSEIDGSEEKELCDKYDVFGYPTLVLFRRGTAVHYYSSRSADEIFIWLKSQLRPAVKELHTLEELIELKDTENATVVGFYNNLTSLKAKEFITIAENFAKPVFAITSNEKIMENFNTTSESILLFEKITGEHILFVDELTLKNMKSFVEIESAPLIHELSPQNAEQVLGGKMKNHLIIFVSKKNNDVDVVLNLAKPVAREYRKKIMFLIINIDDEQLGQIITYFNIKPSQTPAIALISGKKTSKYKMKGTITTENIRTFLHDYEKNKLTRILLSEQLPQNWDKSPVYTLVASNFVAFTKNPETNVVVYFYTMDCKSCPIWDHIVLKLGNYYQSRDDVVVAKINAGANEFDKAPFKEVPSIVLYKKGTNKYVLYKGNPKYEDILQFIETGGVNVEKKSETKVNTEL